MATETFELTDDFEAHNEHRYEQGWTDGLPAVPPIEERVERMLAATTWRRDEVVAVLEPRKGEATVEAIVVNALIAGCRPEYLPVVIVAVEAMGDPGLDIYGVLTSTRNVSPLVLVNEPLAREGETAPRRIDHQRRRSSVPVRAAKHAQ